MKRRFTMQRGTTRVVFGAGSSERIGEEALALGLRRVFVVSTPGRKEDATALAARLGPDAAGVIATAREHVPVEIVADARTEIERSQADGLLAFGGGSAIGLAKALALAVEGRARVVAVPTTYSGSEMTALYGTTERGVKRTGRDERVRPALVVYDPRLTAALPRDVTVTSLWNAMAHAVEALWAREPDRATLLGAEAGLGLLARAALRLGAKDAPLDDEGAREEALEGAYLAAAAFADVGAGLHHKICHVLGGLGLPHAATHAALLPHVIRFYATAAPEAMAAIARALGAIDPVLAVERLAVATGAPRSLEEVGMRREDVARAIDAVLAAPPPGPRTLDREMLTLLFDAVLPKPSPRPEPPRLRGPEAMRGTSGFGSFHESEALPGAIPRRQNAPHLCPYGLYPELLSGTPFTTKNAQNTKMWMYRIRASFSHGEFRPLPSARFASELRDVDPNRVRWRPLPIPAAPARVDFVDGLVTLGGAGEPTAGQGYAVHLYAANADMADRAFSDADGDLLIVPQTGTLDVRTELGWLRVAPGAILVVPRALKFAVGVPEGAARGWVLEVFGTRLRLPERGPIGSNGLADARHFVAPVASYEDRACPAGFEIVGKLGGRLWSATQEHSPFDVVGWHGTHVPFSYDLMLFAAMGTATWDHPDPSIHTVLTAPLDDYGRAVADFVVFRGRWDVAEHSFRPPFMHRNAASEINGVVRVQSASGGYEPGCTFVSPLLTAHGVSTATYDHELSMPSEKHEGPRRLSDESLWIMFESALPFRGTTWSRETLLVDRTFLDHFKGLRSRFDPSRV